MLHELKRIFADAIIHQKKGGKCVLVTVVGLEGSSYRGPGVRMLIDDSGKMTGAISGGCVEKVIVQRAQSVFADGEAKIITYDGRLRLGCEGLLYILIEPFYISEKCFEEFSTSIQRRIGLTVISTFDRGDDVRGRFGSQIRFADGQRCCFDKMEGLKHAGEHQFVQNFNPCFRLLIIGAGHDAVQLCRFASLLGWEVHILTSRDEPKALSDFSGAQRVFDESEKTAPIDSETAIVLMTHNYAADLKHLLALKNTKPAYIGILGSEKRRKQLQLDLVDQAGMFSKIFSPTGLDIGAISPGEIAISILAEITAVVRHKGGVSLRNEIL